MKVCTDACIFGAFAARQVALGDLPAGRILDIGTGTGLLCLMLAQKTNARITALEIDEGAYAQALENGKRSPWNDRLEFLFADATRFRSSAPFDFIISNPPFFEGDLKSGDPRINAARHEHTLSLQQLIATIDHNLAPGGHFAVLLPLRRLHYFLPAAEAAGYYLKHQLLVNQHPGSAFFRAVLVFGQTRSVVEKQELAIRDHAGDYSNSFVELMQDYYLNL